MPPHMKLSRYLRGLRLPAPPSGCDYSGPALPSLRDIMQNDALGDCVIASANHVQGVLTGNAGALVHASSADVLSQYEAIGGYVPGDPSTDQGCDETVALSWYCNSGFADGVKAAGWMAVDASNLAELQTACWLFEHVIFCAELPDAWTSPFPSGDGFTWDAATPDPAQGHSFMAFGYSTAGFLIDSWALFGTLTARAAAACCTPANGGGAYVLLTPEMLSRAQQRSPTGLAWSDLVADFDAMGGTVPLPSPAPPAPVPAPTAPPSLAAAQGAVSAAFAAAHPILLRSQAGSIAAAALGPLWPSS